jgi:G3E family GTPase
MSLLLPGTGSLIPVSVLTGFLGSGKTTVLNRLVRDPAMSRALVVINEFGAIGLDHDLVARSTDDLVVEMMGGCLCCTIRGDLQQTLRDAPFRFARDGKCWFDRVVIETTGLADPAPILHTLMTDERLLSLYRLDGVITTVDAATGMATLDTQQESVKQAAVADRLLLTKTDLAADVDIEALEARLRAMNPAAPILKVIGGDVEAARLFDAGLFNPATKTLDVQRWLNAEAYDSHGTVGHDHGHHGHGRDHHGSDHHHHDVNRHDDRIRAICLTFEEPLDGTGFDRWLGILTMFKGADILRIKGIVNIDGLSMPVVIHGVQHILHTPVALPTWPSDDRRTRIVFIVRDMDEADLRGMLTLMTNGIEQFDLSGIEPFDPDDAYDRKPVDADLLLGGGYQSFAAGAV